MAELGRVRVRRVAASAVLLAHVAIGAAYAMGTPLWQVPDEPAHYRYVAQLVDGSGRPPVITDADYPYAQLEALKATRFAEGSLEGIAYEDHQPPLYYVLAAPGFALATPGRAFPAMSQGAVGERESDARVAAMRLFGVLLGAMAVCLVWACGRVASRRHVVAMGAAAFVAFLPMNLTVTAAVNNDALAGVLAAALLLVSLRRATGRDSGPAFLWRAGLLLALALITKATLYPLAGMVVVAEWVASESRVGLRRAWTAGQPVLVGAVLASPWFLRNMAVYGVMDPMGLRAHEAVVSGEQTTTAALIRDDGVAAFFHRLVTWTFDSFWGVFGWMGVFLPVWMYALLGLATAIAVVGIWLVVRRGSGSRSARAGRVARVLGAAVGATAAAYAYYNLTFAQHQGRYWFPALGAIAIVFVRGLAEVGERSAGARAGGWIAVAGFAVCLLGLAVVSLERYVIPGLSPG